MPTFTCAQDPADKLDVGENLDGDRELYFRTPAESVYLSPDDVRALRNHLTRILCEDGTAQGAVQAGALRKREDAVRRAARLTRELPVPLSGADIVRLAEFLSS